MTRLTACSISLTGLMVLAGAAFGQSADDLSAGVQVTYGGKILPQGVQAGNTDRSLSVVTVYDNSDLNQPGLNFFGSSAKPFYADEMTLQLPRVGEGVFGPIASTVEEVDFPISTTTGGNNDVLVLFYEKPVRFAPGGVAGSGGFATDRFIGGVRFTLPAASPVFPSATVYTGTSLSGLSTPIVLTGNYIGISLAVVLTGTNTLDTSSYALFNGDATAPYVGFSDDNYARDVNNDGKIDETEMSRFFNGYPNISNVLTAVRVNFCDTDFDGSGFSDFDDFSKYVVAFEAGC